MSNSLKRFNIGLERRGSKANGIAVDPQEGLDGLLSQLKTVGYTALAAFFQSTSTEVAFAVVSLAYLLLVLVDLINDELSSLDQDQVGMCVKRNCCSGRRQSRMENPSRPWLPDLLHV